MKKAFSFNNNNVKSGTRLGWGRDGVVFNLNISLYMEILYKSEYLETLII